MSYRKPLLRLAVTLVTLLPAAILMTFATPAMAFPDVPAGHAYETAINGLSSLGIIGGYADGNFGLSDPLKRAQFAKMIVGTLGITPNTSTVTRFTDLGAPDASGYPHKFVQTAFDNGITTGTNPAQTLFAPWDSIRRDQVVSMMVRGANSRFPGVLESPPAGTVSVFGGVAEPHGGNLRTAEYNGLLDGLVGMGASWSVTANATRGEVAQMLWNLLDLMESGSPPPSTMDVSVDADGSGDYPTIESALAAVDPGATIHLGPGTFTLTEPIYADFDLHLVGVGLQGDESTTVTYAGEVLRVSQATVSAEKIRFVSTATTTASYVVVAGDADLHLAQCYLSGANIAGGEGGHGVLLYGTTVATISNCVATLNDSIGISVMGETHATLTSNDCSHNGLNGLGFYDHAVVAASGNTCSNNTMNGIAGNGDARVTLENNVCSGNVGCGIVLFDNVHAEITGNTCNSNDMGIYLMDACLGDVTNNTCDSNVYSGIRFGDTSGGTVQGNNCSNNQWGLYVGADANPTIGSNNLHDNTVKDYIHE